MSERYGRGLRGGLLGRSLAGPIGTNDCIVLRSGIPKGRKKSRIGRRASENVGCYWSKNSGRCGAAIAAARNDAIWPESVISRPRSNSVAFGAKMG